MGIIRVHCFKQPKALKFTDDLHIAKTRLRQESLQSQLGEVIKMLSRR